MKVTIESKSNIWLIDFLLPNSLISKNVEKAINAYHSKREGNGVVINDAENKITVTVEDTHENNL